MKQRSFNIADVSNLVNPYVEVGGTLTIGEDGQVFYFVQLDGDGYYVGAYGCFGSAYPQAVSFGFSVDYPVSLLLEVFLGLIFATIYS